MGRNERLEESRNIFHKLQLGGGHSFPPVFSWSFQGAALENIPGWGSSSQQDLSATAPASAVINEASELSFSTRRQQGKCLWDKKWAGLVTQRLLLVTDSLDRECPIPRQCHPGCHPSPGTFVLLVPKGICLAGPLQVLAGGSQELFPPVRAEQLNVIQSWDLTSKSLLP